MIITREVWEYIFAPRLKIPSTSCMRSVPGSRDVSGSRLVYNTFLRTKTRQYFPHFLQFHMYYLLKYDATCPVLQRTKQTKKDLNEIQSLLNLWQKNSRQIYLLYLSNPTNNQTRLNSLFVLKSNFCVLIFDLLMDICGLPIFNGQ